MEPDGDTSPFWSQPRRHRNPPSPLLNPVVLILAVPILLLLLLFFILPPFISHANQLIRPNSVKKSWDYFNIVLVLFAILCGVFARRNDDVPDEGIVPRQSSVDSTVVSNFVSEPRHSVVNWLEYPDRKVYANATAESGGVRLRRSSSSYPDLRNESLWGSGGGNGNELRFHDDFEVKFYQSREIEHENEDLNLYLQRPQIHSTVVSEEDVRSVVTSPVREIPVDKFEVSSSEPPENPPPPPGNPQPLPENLPQPAAPVKKRRSRSHRSVSRRVKKEVENETQEEVQINEPPPLPVKVEEEPKPEPELEPEPEPEIQFPDVISETVPKKRSGVNVKKEFATAITSLYKGQKRKKKRRVKSRDIYENATENTSPPPPAAVPEPQSTPAPPPPPPPPPPSKMLQNLFKKGTKTKRVHSVPTASPTGAPPPPPPPPPPNSIFNNLFKTGTKSSRFNSSSHAPPLDPPPAPPPLPSSILNSIFKTGSISRRFKHPPPPPPPPPSDPRRSFGRPPKPPRPSNQYADSAIYAPQSPLIPMPPPLPPFRMPEVKFVARGDFVRIQSASSSMCSSPEREDFETSSVKSDGQDLIGSSVTCPSPDVNMKADNFIARLRDEWRLEKMSSMKEKRIVG